MKVLMQFESEADYTRFTNNCCVQGLYCTPISMRSTDDGKIIVVLKFEGLF